MRSACHSAQARTSSSTTGAGGASGACSRWSSTSSATAGGVGVRPDDHARDRVRVQGAQLLQLSLGHCGAAGR